MGDDARNWFFELSRHFGPRWRGRLSLDLEERRRRLAQSEDRTELGLALEACDLSLLGVPLESNLDFLAADINNTLGDPGRQDRSEWYLGFGLATRL